MCFRCLSDFKDVVIFLKKKYDRIINVVSKIKGSNKYMFRLRRGKWYIFWDFIVLVVFLNYCKKSESWGILGIVGRECNFEISGKGSCVYMCCGCGYKIFMWEVVYCCNCEYVWCCYVKC